MRLTLFLATVALAALGDWASAQQPPAKKSDLPTVVKPKPAPEPAPTPDVVPADPNAIPDAEPPVEGKRKPSGSKRTAAKDDSASANAAEGSSGSENPSISDYTGPSILSRGMNFTRPSLPTNERFRPFLGVNFFRDSGVTGQYQGPTSPVVNQTFSGADFNFGISGQHTRRQDAFELDYRGHAYVNSYSGQDHALTLGYERILAKRLALTISETAGLYANNYSVLNSVSTTDTSVANTGLVVTPNTESFDNRTYYSTTQADVTYQRSSRLSLDFGVSTFLVQRGGKNLISANGYQTRSDAAYRLTKKSTLGPYYAYSRYLYSGTFGDTGIHTVGLNYSLALDKRTQFRFRVGGSRVETRGLQVVVLDPLVSQILGVSVGIQRYYAVSYSPDFAVDISRAFRHAQLQLSYLKGVSPGNGVVLTSRRDSISGSYTYSGIRRYAITLGAGRDALGSIAQQIGNFSSYYGRVSISRPLPHNVQALMNFDYRKLGFTKNTYARDQYRISVGFAFAPGASPLRFW